MVKVAYTAGTERTQSLRIGWNGLCGDAEAGVRRRGGLCGTRSTTGERMFGSFDGSFVCHRATTAYKSICIMPWDIFYFPEMQPG